LEAEGLWIVGLEGLRVRVEGVRVYVCLWEREIEYLR
jgi:hypothetical protein